MTDWLETFRFDHPWFYKTLVGLAVLLALMIAFLSLPETPMFRAMGITNMQKRVAAVNNALYWSSRTVLNGTEKITEPKVFYGNMEGIDPQGNLVVTVPVGDQWVKERVTFADVVITDQYGLAQQVGALRFEDVKFEVYLGNQAVVWVRSVPLNVKLIEAGVAIPDPTPPTDIVDAAFATYYWSIVKGKTP